MSRSFKKSSVQKDHQSGVPGKKFANNKVRRTKGDIPNGKAYKKIFCSYDIHDYVSRFTYDQHKHRFERDLKAFLNGVSKRDPRAEKEARWYSDNDWARYYYRK